ncbi:hypothetical protein WMF26_13275 [Sorangium sp. So ce185]|uniref:hypothetical protein n=1 Tax=Sorangium sp. So ce185 TaxID=3133287 RepID=UPI003F5E1063
MGVSNKETIGSKQFTIFDDGNVNITATVPQAFLLDAQDHWEGFPVSLSISNKSPNVLTVTSISLVVGMENSYSNFYTRWKDTTTDELSVPLPSGGLHVRPDSTSLINAGNWQWRTTAGAGATMQCSLEAQAVSYNNTTTSKNNAPGDGQQNGPQIIAPS